MSDEKEYTPMTNRIQGSIKITQSDYIPIVDAHMHIQGNQIAPIPIMKGILVYKAASLGSSLLANEINFFNLSYLENKEIDINILYEKKILPNPDKISLKRGVVKLLAGSIDFFSLDDVILENRERMLDLLAANPNWSKLDNFLKIIEVISAFSVPVTNGVAFLITAGTAILRDDEDKLLKSIIDSVITSAVGDYGKITRFSSYDIAKMYINDNDAENNSIGYANHKISYDKFDDEKYSDSKDSQCNEDLNELMANNKHDYFYKLANDFFDNIDNNKLIYQFSIVHGMELMYAHYWGAAGIPIYIVAGSKVLELCNSVYFENNTLFNIYDIPETDVEKNLAKYKTEEEKVTGETKKYIHFLKEVDAKEVYQFEDHGLHVNYQKLAAYKNPFNLLPFYHIDLRRFFAPTDYIKDTHSFYDFYDKTIYESDEIMEQCKGEWQEEKIEQLADFSGFNLKSSFEDVKNYFIAENVENLDDNTLFWGIKMYVALGCPPYYGLDLALTKKVFPMFEGKDLSRLHTDVENFYKFCIKKDIPITCHGSPQGMTIADPGVYLKEYLKLNNNNKIPYNFAITANSYIQGLGLIDDFSSPYSWEKVLTYPGLSELRLCIAHFGGSRFFDGTFYSIDDNPPCYSWQSKIKELVEKYPNVYTDISCYTFDAGKEHSLPLEKLEKKAEKKGLTIYDLIWQEGEQIESYVSQRIKVIKNIKDCDKRKIRLSMKEVYMRQIFNKSDTEIENLTVNDIKLIIKRVENNIKNAQKNLCYRIYKTAKGLIELLKDDGTLKDKIMYGTDWPMFETSEKLDTYQGNLYAVLKLVTLKLGNKWDAWYQFAVINPLRFLNLIEEKKGKGYVFSDIGKKKLENYKQALELMSDTVQNIAEECHIKFATSGLISGKDYRETLTKILKKINANWFVPNYVIPHSEDIIKKQEESL